LRLAYNLACLRQEENQYISVPSDVARELPDALQALLGYDTLGALGYVEGAKHPKAVLDAGWGARAEGWDPRKVESAARLSGPDWFLTGGPKPPLFPETEEQRIAREKRTQAVVGAMAEARREAARKLPNKQMSAKL
jgi:hypothetical protein